MEWFKNKPQIIKLLFWFFVLKHFWKTETRRQRILSAWERDARFFILLRSEVAAGRVHVAAVVRSSCGRCGVPMPRSCCQPWGPGLPFARPAHVSRSLEPPQSVSHLFPGWARVSLLCGVRGEGCPDTLERADALGPRACQVPAPPPQLGCLKLLSNRTF